jgi:selenocysteine-specific elongation factor
MSKHLIMGTAGHVDHGKTSLIRALTGIDCDTHTEEKERGITINLGFAHLNINNETSIGIVDVPGHKDFIKTMVSGASGIDFMLLVIAADSGIMPQTREHFNIMRLLGVSRGIIALNKADLVDVEMLELAKLEIMEFVEDTPLEDAPVIAVSAHAGTGLDLLKNEISKAAGDVPERSHEGDFRLYIDRIFNVKGQGIVVTGSAIGGQISTGQELFLLPGNYDKIRVKSLQRHGQTLDQIIAGDRAAINVSGLKFETFERGMMLADKILDDTQMVDAHIELFDAGAQLKIWNHVVFYTGTFSSSARLHLLTADSLSAGGKAIAQIHPEKPCILKNNDRFIIRNSSNDITLGGGIILDTQPLHHRRRTEKLKSELLLLADAMINKANRHTLIVLAAEKAGRAVPLHEITKLIGATEDDIENDLRQNKGQVAIVETTAGKFIISEKLKSKIKEQVLNELGVFHKQNILFPHGLELKELKGKLAINSSGETEILAALIKEMLVAKVIKPAGKTYALAGHKVNPDGKTLEQIGSLEQIVLRRGLQRLTKQELEAKALETGISKGNFRMYLRYLSENNSILFTDEDVLHQSVIEEARIKLLRNLSSKPDGINEKEFRELVNAPKKTIQVLIDIFLKEGIITKQTFFLHITEKGNVFFNP